MRQPNRSNITATDMAAFWQTNNAQWAVSPISALVELLLQYLPTSGFITQYASPSATGFSVTISAGTTTNPNVWLILTPTAAYADGAIVLPAGTVDGQEVLVNCTHQITSLTVTEPTAVTVAGAPTSMGADDFFKMKYDLPGKAWYRVG